MGTTDLSRGGFNELVFENRNKEYGAYVIRKEYNERILFAFLITSTVVICSILLFAFTPKNKIVEETILPPTDPLGGFTIKPDEQLPPKEEKKLTPSVKSTKNKDFKIVEKVDSVQEKQSDPELESNPGPTGPPVNSGANTGNGNGPALQIPKEPDPLPQPPKDWAPTMPEFPGGYAKMAEFIDDNIYIPDVVYDQGGTQKAFVYFIVDVDGSVYNVKIIQGTSNAFNEAALNVVKKFPKWEPGKLETGETVPVIMKLPIKVNLRH